MNGKRLSVFHVSAELAPFSKTGGLADVAKSLPQSLFELGHDIKIITPLYGKLIDTEYYKLKILFKNVKLVLDASNSITVNYWQGLLDDKVPVYFIEIKQYFSKHKRVYGSSRENTRFYVFNVAALKLLNLLESRVDVIHCHDWHTGLIPYFIKNKYRYTKALANVKTVFTIHNLAFQMGKNWFNVPLEFKDYGRKKLPLVNSDEMEFVNFAKRAIMSADLINTVSEKYKEEIMTKKFGQNLHMILKNRESDLYGIVNGIDYSSYNPNNDPGLFKNYNYASYQFKNENKLHLQKQLSLTEGASIPLICSTSRVTHQKGFDLIISILPALLRLDLQIVFMGDGDKKYIKQLKALMKKYPKKIRYLAFKQKTETLLYAASDIFILPSYYEPCGINQMIAMRYGSIPVVRETGGLYDTVKNFNPISMIGNGFTFKLADEFSFFWAIVRALENYKYKNVWGSLISKSMLQSSSWEIPAKKYVKLYRLVLKKNR